MRTFTPFTTLVSSLIVSGNHKLQTRGEVLWLPPFCVLCQWVNNSILKIQKYLTLIIMSIRTSLKSEETTHGPDQNVSYFLIIFAKRKSLVYKHAIINSDFILSTIWPKWSRIHILTFLVVDSLCIIFLDIKTKDDGRNRSTTLHLYTLVFCRGWVVRNS